MPIVRIEMWPGRTHAQKGELVIFEDVPKENWAQGGVLASDKS